MVSLATNSLNLWSRKSSSMPALHMQSVSNKSLMRFHDGWYDAALEQCRQNECGSSLGFGMVLDGGIKQK